MSDPVRLHAELVELLRRTALLGSCSAVLGWDEQTCMPTGAAELRGEQLALLAGLAHDWGTAPRIGELLTELATCDLGPADGALAVDVREARRDYDRSVKVPRRLVEEISRTTTLAVQAWIAARKASDFASFRPWLEKVVALKREEAQALGPASGVPYDALLDAYEPGATSESLRRAFAPLRDGLVELVAAVRDSGRSPDVSLLARSYPVDAQRRFAEEAARRIGFDFARGRLDTAAHPFCSGVGPGDCRLTTRYDEHHFPGAFFGVLHEAGHGLYEQGLDAAAFGTPRGQTASLGIHESQSRLWENFVGRGRAFWEYFFPAARHAFPEALTDVPLDAFHAAVNDVRPSFIRVEADEATYNLHVMLRFELELPLISGDLRPADVPGAWNETFRRFFGIDVPDDARGCLQDIHWGHGLIGYFPTYALGNMHAAQMFEAAARDLGDPAPAFARGEFAPLLEWLREKVHRPGRTWVPDDLQRRISGASLSCEPLLRHLRGRFAPLYGL